MNATPSVMQRTERFELRFASLFNDGRGLAFPCDNCGCVDIDALPDRARNNYLVARTLVGRDFTTPKLQQIFQQ